MTIRCGPVIFSELITSPTLNLANITEGGPGYEDRTFWRCIAPHLDGPVELELEHLKVLETVQRRGGMKQQELAQHFSQDVLAKLFDAGLLVDDEFPGHFSLKERMDAISSVPLDSLASIYCATMRWEDVNLEQSKNTALSPGFDELVRLFGPPPTHDYCRADSIEVFSLAKPTKTFSAEALNLRRSCRSFSPSGEIKISDFSAILSGPWGVLEEIQELSNFTVLKKRVPSGGSLHPVEAYVLVRRVESLRSGLYHYRAGTHELSFLNEMSNNEIKDLAQTFCAGQSWASEASFLIIMTGRLDRQAWKYRKHPKSLKVLYMDAGHLSQLACSIAEELSLGAVVSGAINEKNIEEALGLNWFTEIPIAVIAIGQRN